MTNRVFIYSIPLVLAMTCSERTTRLDSDDLNTIEERVQVLKQEIRCFSDIRDAEFELFNVNGFSNQRQVAVPGASSWDYKFVVRVDTADVRKWRAGMTRLDTGHDNSWMNEIVNERKENWRTTSQPIYYGRTGENVMVVEFYADGIIFKRVRAE